MRAYNGSSNRVSTTILMEIRLLGYENVVHEGRVEVGGKVN